MQIQPMLQRNRIRMQLRQRWVFGGILINNITLYQYIAILSLSIAINSIGNEVFALAQ